MPTDPSTGPPDAEAAASAYAKAPSERRAWRRVATGCEAAAVLAWLLLVLRDQYGVVSLQPYNQVTFDELFLAAIAGAGIARALARRSAAEGRAFALRLVLLAGMTALALVSAEYLARFQFRRAHTSQNAGDFIARRGGWSPGPSNSLGFREREIPPKSAARYRIVVVGDSFTWGQGIERAERFSDLLGQFLGPRFEVFNFGLPGDKMAGHVTRLTQALAVSPDFVLLQLYPNDFETPQMVRPRPYPLLPQPLGSRLERSSLLYQLGSGLWAHVQELAGVCESYTRYMERNLHDPDAPAAREASGQLHEFFVRARAAGVPAGGVLFPATDAFGPNGTGYPFGYLHDAVRHACTDEDVSCLDLFQLFTTFPDPKAVWVGPFDAHPNAMANRRVAYEILNAFGSAWQH
jgi:GDSL-like Lipase/Acylhydrolase family